MKTLPESFVKNKLVRALAKQILEANGDEVSTSQEKRGPEGNPSAIGFRESAAVLEIQANLIAEFKHKEPTYDGYPVVDHEGILYFCQKEVQKLLDVSRLTESEQNEHILAPLVKLVDCIHLLPATAANHHRGLGGLLEHSLECARFAAEMIKDEIPERHEENNARILPNRWIAAVILCALFHDLGKIKVNVKVFSKDRRKLFDPMSGFLTDWAFEKIGVGNTYFVSWELKNRTHETEILSMVLVNNLITSNTIRWLGPTVAEELFLFLKNSPRSRLRRIIGLADNQSAERSLRFGQFQGLAYEPGQEEVGKAFETIKRMLAYGEEFRDEDGEPKEFYVNGLRLRGWTVNTPTSAVVYADQSHLFIFWEDFKRLRVDYELAGRSSSIFNLSKSCSRISSTEYEQEFESLAEKLREGNYLQLNSNPTAGDNPAYWYVYRFDPKTQNLGQWPSKAICLNELAIKRIFEYRELPAPNPSLVSILESENYEESNHEEHVVTAVENKPEGESAAVFNPIVVDWHAFDKKTKKVKKP